MGARARAEYHRKKSGKKNAELPVEEVEVPRPTVFHGVEVRPANLNSSVFGLVDKPRDRRIAQEEAWVSVCGRFAFRQSANGAPTEAGEMYKNQRVDIVVNGDVNSWKTGDPPMVAVIRHLLGKDDALARKARNLPDQWQPDPISLNLTKRSSAKTVAVTVA